LSLRDYLSLTKPRIIPLIVFVGFASSFIASHGFPNLNVVSGIVLGGGLATAGSLVINSYLEMDIDSRMRRTMHRPLPQKRIVPPMKALIFGFLLLAAGLTVAFFTLNLISTFFIVLGSLIYIVIYTLILKPRTSLNIVLGGFAGSCACLAGWYAVTFSGQVIAWILAILVFVWTPSHFWSLAVVTEEDYSAVGIPMLPSILGPREASRYIVFNTLVLIPFSLLLAPFLRGYGLFIYLGFTIITGITLLITNIRLLMNPTKENAWLAFKFSSPYLALVFLVAMIASIL
jgi:protoheme IX farnesyltransferase